MTEPVLIALGANLGDPLDTLDRTVQLLRLEAGLLRVSSPWLTTPVGGPPGQPDFINAVALAVPPAPLREPRVLLDWLLAVERRFGRERSERWAARTLDLDLLAFGDRVLDLPGLQLPHPRLAERPFVLAPLSELWSDWRHPVTGATAADLLARTGSAGVTRLPPRW